jgi:site-specific DNA-methyltransferase (adenine-specific)
MNTILQGDCIEVLKTLPENSVDSIVTDPPYGLEFMGKDWDAPWKKSEVVKVTDKSTNGIFHDKGFNHGIRFSRGLFEMQEFQKWCESWAKEAYRVLKPGGHILAFGGSRTYHRLAGGIEDAGFEIRDQIMWVYGSGFPKSMNVGLALEKKGLDPEEYAGWGTALKPAHEPIVMARKPLEGTVVDNLLAWGTGAINIDESRVPGEPVPINKLEEWSGFGQKTEPDYEQEINSSGRFPANFIHDGSDEVTKLFPRSKGGAYPAKRGKAVSTTFASGQETEGGFRAMGDDGSASRFFYCAKTNSKERHDGLGKEKNTHPTVKPTELMRYLLRLITPPAGVVLDPFMGSGSTGRAAVLDGFSFIGIDQNAEYVEIAKKRVDAVDEL